MVFFKEYKRTDLILAALSSVIIISTFMILNPSVKNGGFTQISSNVIKTNSSYVLGFSVIVIALIIIIAGFIIGKHHHKKGEKEIKEIIPKDKTLPVFETSHKDIVIEPPRIIHEVTQEKDIVAQDFMADHLVKDLDISKNTPITSDAIIPDIYTFDTPHDKQFFLSDGGRIKNIKELKEKVESLPDEIFYRHVGTEYNHFADWIEGVFNEKTLAQKLRSSKTKDEFKAALNN